MARFDNRSSSQPVLMFGTDDFDSAGSPTSVVLDTKDYDAGYTIAVNAVNLGAGTVDMTIETSDDSSSGFVAVATDKLIGGAIPNLNNTLLSGNGAVSVARGVVDDKRFVRVVFANPASIPATVVAMFVTLNGAVEGAPPEAAEGTDISV